MAESPQSAPELPDAVAKQYGLKPSKSKQSAKNADSNAEPESALIENPETDTAVDDILAKEGDSLLNAQDQTKLPMQTEKPGFGAKLRRFFVHWWRNKFARYATITFLLLAVIVPVIVPSLRYKTLNLVGVRSSASVVVLDNATSLPLKNVSVRIADSTAQTDREGRASLKGLRLGGQMLTIDRPAFASISQKVTIGWGSNPLGEFEVRAVGLQYIVSVTDYLSGKAVAGAEAESGSLNALSDKEGKLILTVDDTNATELNVQIQAPGYRTETVNLKAANTVTAARVTLVPAAKYAFVGLKDGVQNVYVTDVDGKNYNLLLANIGTASGVMNGVVVTPDSSRAIVVSTRDGEKNSDGFVLRSLAFVPLSGGGPVTVDRSENIQLVGWLGNRLIYRTTIAGLSAANSSRNRLIAYDPVTNAKVQLANANDFTVVVSRQGALYYSPSSNDPAAKLGLFKVKPDGSGREQIVNQDVWAAGVQSYENIALQSPSGWQTFTFDTKQIVKSAAPTGQNRIYAADSQDKRVAWVQPQDGKTLVMIRDLAIQKDIQLASGASIQSLQWVGDKALVYRQLVGSELTDFVVSPDGGEPHKLSIVQASTGYTTVY